MHNIQIREPSLNNCFKSDARDAGASPQPFKQGDIIYEKVSYEY